jgi:hypothetical protein
MGKQRQPGGGRRSGFLSVGRWALLMLGTGCFAALHAEGDEELNNGEDFARPVTRFDLRYRFQEGSDGVDKEFFILRRDVTFGLSEDWQLVTRVDVPLGWSNAMTADNPSRHADFGLGDVLWQAVVVDKVSERFAWGGGLRTVFPTATEDALGSGKYLLSPVAGVRWKLPEISHGSFFQFTARYDSDIGGDDDRSHVSRLRFSPTLNVSLPDRWYVSLFPSQDFAVDFLKGDRWFVPADFLIGRNLTERIVASLEVSVPVIKEFTLYNFKLQARLSLHL